MGSEGKRSFIPRDRPRSWVILVVACLGGFLFGASSALLESSLGVSFGRLPVVVLAVCVPIAVLSAAVYLHGLLVGRYRDIRARPWRDQVW